MADTEVCKDLPRGPQRAWYLFQDSVHPDDVRAMFGAVPFKHNEVRTTSLRCEVHKRKMSPYVEEASIELQVKAYKRGDKWSFAWNNLNPSIFETWWTGGIYKLGPKSCVLVMHEPGPRPFGPAFPSKRGNDCHVPSQDLALMKKTPGWHLTFWPKKDVTVYLEIDGKMLEGASVKVVLTEGPYGVIVPGLWQLFNAAGFQNTDTYCCGYRIEGYSTLIKMVSTQPAPLYPPADQGPARPVAKEGVATPATSPMGRPPVMPETVTTPVKSQNTTQARQTLTATEPRADVQPPPAAPASIAEQLAVLKAVAQGKVPLMVSLQGPPPDDPAVPAAPGGTESVGDPGAAVGSGGRGPRPVEPELRPPTSGDPQQPGYLDHTATARPARSGDIVCFVCGKGHIQGKNSLHTCDNECGWGAHRLCLKQQGGLSYKHAWYCCQGCRKEHHARAPHKIKPDLLADGSVAGGPPPRTQPPLGQQPRAPGVAVGAAGLQVTGAQRVPINMQDAVAAMAVVMAAAVSAAASTQQAEAQSAGAGSLVTAGSMPSANTQQTVAPAQPVANTQHSAAPAQPVTELTGPGGRPAATRKSPRQPHTQHAPAIGATGVASSSAGNSSQVAGLRTGASVPGSGGQAAVVKFEEVEFRAMTAGDAQQPGYMDNVEGLRAGGCPGDENCIVCKLDYTYPRRNPMLVCSAGCGWGGHMKCLQYMPKGQDDVPEWFCSHGCRSHWDAQQAAQAAAATALPVEDEDMEDVQDTTTGQKEEEGDAQQQHGGEQQRQGGHTNAPATTSAGQAAGASLDTGSRAQASSVAVLDISAVANKAGAQPGSDVDSEAATVTQAGAGVATATDTMAATGGGGDTVLYGLPSMAAPEQGFAVLTEQMGVQGGTSGLVQVAAGDTGGQTNSSGPAAQQGSSRTQRAPSRGRGGQGSGGGGRQGGGGGGEKRGGAAGGGGGDGGRGSGGRPSGSGGEGTDGLRAPSSGDPEQPGFMDVLEGSRPDGDPDDEKCLVCRSTKASKKNPLYQCDNGCGWGAHHTCLRWLPGAKAPEQWYCCQGCMRQHKPESQADAPAAPAQAAGQADATSAPAQAAGQADATAAPTQATRQVSAGTSAPPQGPGQSPAVQSAGPSGRKYHRLTVEDLVAQGFRAPCVGDAQQPGFLDCQEGPRPGGNTADQACCICGKTFSYNGDFLYICDRQCGWGGHRLCLKWLPGYHKQVPDPWFCSMGCQKDGPRATPPRPNAGKRNAPTNKDPAPSGGAQTGAQQRAQKQQAQAAGSKRPRATSSEAGVVSAPRQSSESSGGASPPRKRAAAEAVTSGAEPGTGQAASGSAPAAARRPALGQALLPGKVAAAGATAPGTSPRLKKLTLATGGSGAASAASVGTSAGGKTSVATEPLLLAKPSATPGAAGAARPSRTVVPATSTAVATVPPTVGEGSVAAAEGASAALVAPSRSLGITPRQGNAPAAPLNMAAVQSPPTATVVQAVAPQTAGTVPTGVVEPSTAVVAGSAPATVVSAIAAPAASKPPSRAGPSSRDPRTAAMLAVIAAEDAAVAARLAEQAEADDATPPPPETGPEADPGTLDAIAGVAPVEDATMQQAVETDAELQEEPATTAHEELQATTLHQALPTQPAYQTYTLPAEVAMHPGQVVTLVQAPAGMVVTEMVQDVDGGPGMNEVQQEVMMHDVGGQGMPTWAQHTVLMAPAGTMPAGYDGVQSTAQVQLVHQPGLMPTSPRQQHSYPPQHAMAVTMPVHMQMPVATLAQPDPSVHSTVAPTFVPEGCSPMEPIPQLPYPVYTDGCTVHPASITAQMMALARLLRYLGRAHLVPALMKAFSTNTHTQEFQTMVTTHYSVLLTHWEFGDVANVLAVFQEHFQVPVE